VSPRNEQLLTEALAIRTRMEDLASEWGRGTFTQAQVGVANREMTERLARIEGEMTRTSRAPALRGLVGHGIEVRAAWDALALDRQRAAVDALMQVNIQRIKGRPGGGPGLTITWRT
jgi:site-specific DNA recombinase